MKKPKNKENKLKKAVEVNDNKFNFNDDDFKTVDVNPSAMATTNVGGFNVSGYEDKEFNIDVEGLSQSISSQEDLQPEKKPNIFQRIGNKIFRNSNKNSEKTEEVVAESENKPEEVKPAEEDADQVKQEMLAQEVAKTESGSNVDAPLTEQQFQEIVAGDIKKLKEDLKGFSEDYIESLRKTDYYKQRLEYWKNYYKNLRMEADKQNADKEAQLDALTELDKKDKVKVETDKSSQLDVAEEVLDDTKEKAQTQDAKQEDKKEEKEVEVSSEQPKPKRVFKTTVQSADTASFVDGVATTGKSKEELKKQIDRYANQIVIELLGKSLSETRDRARIQQLNYKTKKSVGSNYLCKFFKNRTNLLNECLASFTEVYKNGKSENKRAVSSHQKSIGLHNQKPDLMSSGDMIAESLRTEYAPAIAEYLSERIASSIVAQNRQDDIKITKSSVSKMMQSVIASSTPDLAEVMDRTYNATIGVIDRNTEKLNLEKSNLDQKFDNAEQRKLVEKDIDNKLRYYKYSKVVMDDKKKNEIKKLDQKSTQILFDEIVELEVERSLGKYNTNDLSDYVFGEKEAKDRSEKIINRLEKSRDDKSLALPSKNEIDYEYTVDGIDLPDFNQKKTKKITRRYYEAQLDELRTEKRKLEEQNKSETISDEQKESNENRIAEIVKQDNAIVQQYISFLRDHPNKEDSVEVEELAEER